MFTLKFLNVYSEIILHCLPQMFSDETAEGRAYDHSDSVAESESR